jgi:hypothetical protein
MPASALDVVTALTETHDHAAMRAVLWRLILRFDGDAVKDPVGWVERQRRREAAEAQATEDAAAGADNALLLLG